MIALAPLPGAANRGATALSGSEVVHVLVYAAVVTAGVGAGAAMVLLMSKRRGILLQSVVVAVVPVLAVTATVLWAATSMFLSPSDVVILSVALSGAGALAAGLATWLGIGLASSIRDLSQTLRSFTQSTPPVRSSARSGSAELVALGRQLESTSRQLREAQRRAARTEQSRRELVAWVAHDLRTPLSAIQALSEALVDGVVIDGPSVARYHATIWSEAQRLSGMVGDLFELSRIQAGALRLTKEWVLLSDVIRQAVGAATITAKPVEVVLRVEGAQVPVYLAEAEIGRVLRNLIDNAIRHTPRGERVVVQGASAGDDAIVTVSDACGGIPEADLDRVFEPGWRGEPARSSGEARGGMGLAIAKGLVEAHGGRISVENTGSGCRFALRLPRGSKRQAPS